MKENERCNQCGRRIKKGRVIWLEMDSYNGTFHKPGMVPEQKSQGCFPFGASCAKKILSGTYESLYKQLVPNQLSEVG